MSSYDTLSDSIADAIENLIKTTIKFNISIGRKVVSGITNVTQSTIRGSLYLFNQFQEGLNNLKHDHKITQGFKEKRSAQKLLDVQRLFDLNLQVVNQTNLINNISETNKIEDAFNFVAELQENFERISENPIQEQKYLKSIMFQDDHDLIEEIESLISIDKLSLNKSEAEAFVKRVVAVYEQLDKIDREGKSLVFALNGIELKVGEIPNISEEESKSAFISLNEMIINFERDVGCKKYILEENSENTETVTNSTLIVDMDDISTSQTNPDLKNGEKV